MKRTIYVLTSLWILSLVLQPAGRAQTYSDNFTRANSNTRGLSWVQVEDPNCPGSLQILNNTLRTTLCGAFGYWNDVFPNDQTSKLQYSGTEDDGGRDIGGPAVRIDPNGTQTNATLYMAEYDRQNGIIRLWKYLNQPLTGPGTQLGSDVAATLASGDFLELRVQGTTLTVLKNTATLIQVTDADIASGRGGVGLRSTGMSGALSFSSWTAGAFGGGGGADFTDNFTRANSNTLGLSWVQVEDPNCPGSLQILNNNLRTTLCGAFGYWNDTWTSDQGSKLQYSGTEDDGGRDVGGPAVRIDPNGTQTNATLYMAEYDRQNGIIRLWKYVNQPLTGPGTQLGSDVTATLASGDWLELDVQGSTLTVLQNTTALITINDTAITSGKGGVALRSTGMSGALSFSNWLGGALNANGRLPNTGGGCSSICFSVSPATATLSASQTQQFTAAVTGTTNTAVTWSLSPSAGSISNSGLYTAPSTITSGQTVTVTATSVADVTKTGSATVTLSPGSPSDPYTSYTGTDVRLDSGTEAPPSQANTFVNDLAFGSRILRVTDETTCGRIPSCPGTGDNFLPSQAGFYRTWNSDSTAFKLETVSGTGYWMEFNATNFNVGDGSTQPTPHLVRYGATWEWSAVNPSIIYVLNGTKIGQYTPCTTEPNQHCAEVDLAGPSTGDPVASQAVVIGQDNWVCSAAGSGQQNTYTKLFCVQPGQTSVTTLIDILAQTINGTFSSDPNWPKTGDVDQCGGTQIGIHSISGGTGSKWLGVTFHCNNWSKDGEAVFDLGSNTWSLVKDTDNLESGHPLVGNGYFANASGTPDTKDSRGAVRRDPDNLMNSSEYLYLMTPPVEWGQCDAEHSSWLNSLSNPAAPVLYSRYHSTNDTNICPGTQYAWNGEIIAAAVDGSGTVWRFAHNHNGFMSCGFYGQSFAQISPDGHWAIFSTYWNGTLAASSDGFACSGTRTDTFIVELK